MPANPMKIWGHGTCENCHADDVDLVAISDDIHVCEKCRDMDYIQCDECGEFWNGEHVKMYKTADGRWLCEYCYDGEELEQDKPEVFQADEIRDCTADGIFFCPGDAHTVLYDIKPGCFTKLSPFKAYSYWVDHLVNESDKLDEFAYFYKRESEGCFYNLHVYIVPKGRPLDPKICASKNINDEESVLLAKGIAPRGWERVTAKEASLSFDYVKDFTGEGA